MSRWTDGDADADADADAVTPSSNTRSYTRRIIPLSFEWSIFFTWLTDWLAVDSLERFKLNSKTKTKSVEKLLVAASDVNCLSSPSTGHLWVHRLGGGGGQRCQGKAADEIVNRGFGRFDEEGKEEDEEDGEHEEDGEDDEDEEGVDEES